MKSKYPGTCKGCKEPYGEGTDIFWSSTEGGWHWLCRENQPADSGAFRLADALGFINAKDLPADRLLLYMRDADRKFAAGRSQPETLPRQEPIVFDEE